MLFLAFVPVWAASNETTQSTPASLAPNTTNLSAPASAPPYQSYDGINIYFGNDSQLSLFSCADQRCYPGFGAAKDYQSFGQPIGQREVALAVNFSQQAPGTCLLKLVSDQSFQSVRDENGSPAAFGDGRLAYSFTLEAGAPMKVEAQKNQLCISSSNESGMMVLLLTPGSLQTSPAPDMNAPQDNRTEAYANGIPDSAQTEGVAQTGAAQKNLSNITPDVQEKGIAAQQTGSWLGPGSGPLGGQNAQAGQNEGQTVGGVLLPLAVVLVALAIAAFALFSHRSRPKHAAMMGGGRNWAAASYRGPGIEPAPAKPAMPEMKRDVRPDTDTVPQSPDARTSPATAQKSEQSAAPASGAASSAPAEQKPKESKENALAQFDIAKNPRNPPASDGTDKKEAQTGAEEKKSPEAPPWAKGAASSGQKKSSDAPPWAD